MEELYNTRLKKMYTTVNNFMIFTESFCCPFYQKALAKSSGIVDNTGKGMRLSITWA